MSNPSQQDRLNELAELSGDVIYQTDAGGRITFVSETALAVLGYEPDALEGSHYSTILAPQGRKEAYRLYSEQMLNASPHTYLELGAVTRQGARIRMSQTATPLIVDGAVRGLRVLARDISERHRLSSHEKKAADQMRLLHKIALSDGTPVDRLRGALSRAIDLLGLQLGFVGRAAGDEIQIVHYTPEDSGLLEGQRVPKDRSWSGLVVTRNDVVAEDGLDLGGAAPSERPSADDAASEFNSPRAFIGAPIRVAGATVGVLGFASPDPKPDGFSCSDKEFVILLADWWGGLVERAGLGEQASLLDHRIQAITEATQDGVVCTDNKGRIISLNTRAEEILGSCQKIVGEDIRLFLPSFLKLAGSRSRGTATPGARADGQAFEAELSVATASPGLGGGLLGVFRDLTASGRHASRFARVQATLNALFESGDFPMGVVSQRGNQVVHLSANSKAIDVFGLLQPGPGSGQGAPRGLPSAALWEVACGRCLAHRKPTVFELRHSGRQFNITVCLIEDDGGDTPRFSYSGQEVTASIVAARHLEEATAQVASLRGEADQFRAAQAEHRIRADGLSQEVALKGSLDSLTGLLNRSGFEDAVRRAISCREEQDQSYWVILLNVDGFQAINESLGRAGADQILEKIAGRLRRVIATDDPIARVDGNEFAILLTDGGSEHKTRRVVAEISTALEEPYSVDHRTVKCTVCAGAVHGEVRHADAADVLRDADLALGQARQKAPGTTSFLTRRVRDRVLQRLDLESGIREAITDRELEVYYQPIVDLETGRISGLEGTLQWEHPELGLLTGDAFASSTQDQLVLTDLAEVLLDTGAMQLAYWRNAYPRYGNLLLHVQDFGATDRRTSFQREISSAEEKHGLPAGSIVAQLPRGSRPVQNDDRVWPVTVGALPDSLLLRAYNDLARGLGIAQLATDITSIDHLRLLQELGYQLGQGSLFSPARTASSAERVLVSPGWAGYWSASLLVAEDRAPKPLRRFPQSSTLSANSGMDRLP